jgi:hypothetical protein
MDPSMRVSISESMFEAIDLKTVIGMANNSFTFEGFPFGALLHKSRV